MLMREEANSSRRAGAASTKRLSSSTALQCSLPPPSAPPPPPPPPPHTSSIADTDRKSDVVTQTVAERRVLRSHYLLLKRSISAGDGDDRELSREDFYSMINRVDDLHNLVRQPREQIADAEALLDITNRVLKSVRGAQRADGVSPADFVTALIQAFGQMSGRNSVTDELDQQIDWTAIGIQACNVFGDASGLCTMLGPMDSQPKRRRVNASRRGRTRAAETAHPETIADGTGEEKSETDKNIRTMFNILRKCGDKGVYLESLVLNRESFSQTVENLFFLSFLVKDGRAEITLNDGRHIVVFRYAPSADERSGRSDKNGRKDAVVNSQFVFRLDYSDWNLMGVMVEDGKELMPNRSNSCPPASSMTPIRKNSRNRGRETSLTIETSES